MTDQRKRFAAILPAIGSAVSCLVPGCAGVFRPCGNHAQPAPAQALPAPTAGPAFEPDERVTLAAVEEFLRRTQDYQVAPRPSGSSGPAVPKMPTRPPAYSAPERHPDTGLRSEGGSRRSQVAPAQDKAFANTQVALREIDVTEPAPALPVIQAVSIRAVAVEPAPLAEPPRSSTTNEPLAVQPEEVVLAADRFVAHLNTLAEEAKDFAAEWRLRLVQLALSRDAEAVDVSPNLSPDAQRLLAGLVRAGAAIRRIAGDPLLTGDEALARIEVLRQVVADRADPVVSAIALCRKVVTFGVYEEMSHDSFVAGRSIPTIVYSEIRNLRSEPQSDEQFRTSLATRLEVLTGDGESVWEREEAEIGDLCRRRRTDFFIAQRIVLPPTLGPGEYVLKVLVEDKLSGRANEATHGFAIRSPASLAASH